MIERMQEVDRLQTEREKEVLLEGGCQSSANDMERQAAAWELDHLSVVICLLFVCLLVWVMLGSRNSFCGILKHCLWCFVQLKCA